MMETNQSPRQTTRSPAGHIEFKVVKERTIIAHMEDVLPECYREQDKRPLLPTVICLQQTGACDKGSLCMPALAKRVNIIFSVFVDATLLLLLFGRRGEDSTFGLIVKRDFSLRTVRCNKSGLDLVMQQGRTVLGKLPVGFF
jgi:hypothetical protein